MSSQARNNGWFFGKVALVTGATSGIGRAISEQLAIQGAQVLACGRDRQAMDRLLKALNMDSSAPAAVFFADLSTKESLQEMIAQVNSNYDVDILVNNAGFGWMEDFYSMPEDKISSMQEVNMSAVVRLCRHFLPKMMDKPGTGILNIGSIASFFSTPGSALYGATKNFVLAFTDALHWEMLAYGVHITGVYPGHTESRFAERATQGKMQKWRKAMPASAVAKTALNGFEKNTMRVIPGIGNKVRFYAAHILPASTIMNKVYKRPLKHQRN